MRLQMNERKWHVLGIGATILATALMLTGLIITQIHHGNRQVQIAGATLTALAGLLIIFVMYYTCITTKNNYKLFAVYSFGEPEERTDLKRRVLATDDPVPENLLPLAAISSVTSQGNTLRNVPAEIRSSIHEEEETTFIDTNSQSGLIDNVPSTSNAFIGDTGTSRSVAFDVPGSSRSSAEQNEYETIGKYPPKPNDIVVEDVRSSRTASVITRDSAMLPAHYVGTDDERIEELLEERPGTPSDGSGSIQEAIYDVAEKGPEPDQGRNEPDSNFSNSNPLENYDIQNGGSYEYTTEEKRRGFNLLRRNQKKSGFNTYENATGKRGRFFKKGVNRQEEPSESALEKGSVDVERASTAQSELSVAGSFQSGVSSNLIF